MIDPTTAAEIDSWIFDLDNTLYPRSCNLFKQIDQRISDYVARTLGVDRTSARQTQRAYYQKYGTTLRGMIEEHQTVPAEFLHDVHDIDYTPVSFDPDLKQALSQLPGKKFIFTNGTTDHAKRVTDRLEVTDQFSGFFDIVSADLIPKPAEATYLKFLKETGINPKKAAMFEDLARNLAVPDALGMVTVLVHPKDEFAHFAHPWELAGRDEPFVHHQTTDLTDFLQHLNRCIEGKSH